jgi:hypothetical protein
MRSVLRALPALLTAFVLSAAFSAPARAEFKCGPYAYAYEVFDTDGRPGPGVRCIRFVDHLSFVWYGEGRWGQVIYRHLGWAKHDHDTNVSPQRVFKGHAADFFGNGENVSSPHPGTISLTASDGTYWTADRPPGEIQVRGAWNENWILRGQAVASVTPQPPVRRCGPNMRQFGVNMPSPGDENARTVTSDDSTFGVRCLLDADGKFPAAWYGEGAWAGSAYRHIGTAGFWVWPHWGASDICTAGTAFCGATKFGDLHLRPVGDARTTTSIRVTGGWNEWWDR